MRTGEKMSETKTVQVTTTLEIGEDFLGDVLVTAFDGQYGGCWYWADWAFEDAQENGTKVLDVDGNKWLRVRITQEEESGVESVDNMEKINGFIVVDHDTLVRGIEYVMRGTDTDGRPCGHKQMRDAILQQDAGDIDSGDADTLVQLGIYGEVIFG